MANMSVLYRGPDPSLIALTNELRAHYGNPARTYEYVTGYKSPSNFSGHNPDSNGVVHAVDIFTDDHGNIPQAEGRALADRLRMVGRATNRFLYLIHDMSVGVPRPVIASLATGWEWVAYTGADAHSDHIHLSIADGYWGDPCPLPPSVYNDTSPWNVTGGTVAKPQGGNITIIPKKEWFDDMNKKQLDDLNAAVYKINRYLDAPTGAIPGKVWATTVKRGGGKVSALQELADAKTAAQTAVATNAALKEALAQVAKGQGVTIDYTKIEAAAAAGVASALAEGVDLDATVNLKQEKK